MLIPFSECIKIAKEKDIEIKGILHIGAHHCEEFKDYVSANISPTQIVWLEANPELVNYVSSLGIPNVYNIVVDIEEKECVFNISNNGQSSSLLPFGTHKQSYSYIDYVKFIPVKTKRLDTFFSENSGLDISNKNFWTLDIQGVELNALKSAGEYLKNVDMIYSEVNIEYVYKNCSLLHEMDDYLKGFGFTRVKTEMTTAGWGDALWIKK